VNKLRLSTTLSFLLFATLLYPQSKHAGTEPATTLESKEVHVAMRNVMYHYTEPVAVHIYQLQGELRPAKAGEMIAFDDKNSFTLVLSSAEVAINCNSLAQVLNQNVFSSAGAPIKNLSIASKNNQLIIKGQFHQKGDVAFETTGTLSANGDGRIRLHSEHVKAAHLPVKGIMDLLGIDLARLINTNKIRGVSVDKDDILIDPQQLLPPPHIQGKVTAVRIDGNDIVQVFGSPQAPTFAAKQAGNFIALHSADVRFGKLTVHDDDVIMLDMDPRDPFDFYLDHLKEQLVAGYVKSTANFGLRVYARDYGKLQKPARTRTNARARKSPIVN
jgi:hypothetical protein